MLDEALDSLEDPLRFTFGNATLSLSSSPPTDPRDSRVFLRVRDVKFLVSIIDLDRTVARKLNVLPTIDAPRLILFDVLFDDRDGETENGPQALQVAEGMHNLPAIRGVSISGSCTLLSSSSWLLSSSLSSWSVIDDEVGAHESLLDSTSLTMLTVCGRGRR